MRVPLGRLLTPTKLLKLILFLALGWFLIEGLIFLKETVTEWQPMLYKVRETTPLPINLSQVNYGASTGPSPDRAVTHIGFLKVHKAASSTAQAIFLRFGWRRNLTFVLPPEYNAFKYPNVISINQSITHDNILPPPENRTFDILCHHVLYNKTAWDDVLAEDSVIIGTIREPTEVLISMYYYLHPTYITKIRSFDKLGTFLQNPMKYEPKDLAYSMTNNRMAYEYGVHPDIIHSRDLNSFMEYLKVLDKEFKLVIVAERFDESLVLMKRYLKWSLIDILYTRKNVRPVDKGNKYSLDHSQQQLYKNFSIFDYKLYEFFYQRLSRQIQEEGESFADEVTQFKKIIEQIAHFCHEIKSVRFFTVDGSKWHSAFTITRDACEFLDTDEIPFTQNIRRRQYGIATWVPQTHP